MGSLFVTDLSIDIRGILCSIKSVFTNFMDRFDMSNSFFH
jgi:hypothetical protein